MINVPYPLKESHFRRSCGIVKFCPTMVSIFRWNRCRLRSIGMSVGRGSKIGKFVNNTNNKKAQNQLCWLKTHMGCSTASHHSSGKQYGLNEKKKNTKTHSVGSIFEMHGCFVPQAWFSSFTVFGDLGTKVVSYTNRGGREMWLIEKNMSTISDKDIAPPPTFFIHV